MPYGTRPCSPPSRHLLLGSQRACDTELWLGHRQTVRCLPPPSLAPSTLRLRALRPPPAPPQAVSVTNLPACPLVCLLAHCRACPLCSVTNLLALQVVLTDSGPMLKVDLAATTMLAPMAVLDFVAYKLGENLTWPSSKPDPGPDPDPNPTPNPNT
jgi:hypothetical protein